MYLRPEFFYAVHILGSLAKEPIELAVQALIHCLGYDKKNKNSR